MATDAKVIKKKAQVLRGNAKRRCADKGVELHLQHEWVEKHLERGTCELTGIPFSFDVYYYDMRQFLNFLGINPQGKVYSDEKVSKLYYYLIYKVMVKYGK